MSGRGSRSATFLGKHKEVKFKKGKLVATATDLKQLENLFARWKKKPWSPTREKTLGKLSIEIFKAKNHLKGVNNYSSLKVFGAGK